MQENEIENIDSLNDEGSADEVIIDDTSDIETLRAELDKTKETNKKLFVRAKKAEGFDFQDGKWTKAEKAESKPTNESKSQKSNDLDYGQLALLRTEGIKGAGEVALVREIMAETGKGVLDVIDSNYFKSRIADFRDVQATKDAIPKGKNRSGQQGASDVDVAYAKFQETGELPSDLTTRIAIKNKLVAAEKDKNLFQGPSVIGPKLQSY